MTQAFAGLTIDSAELRVVNLPLITPFTVSNQTLTDKTFPLLTLRADGLEGYGEGVMDPYPDYLEETLPGALAFLRDLILPQIVGKRIGNPAELTALLAPWRGHKMSKALVELAFWDLWTKALNLPLCAALGGLRDAVPVGVSLGITPIDRTLERIAEAEAAGYKRIKLKVAQGHDLKLLEAVRREFPAVKLTVDANTAYGLADLATLRAMDRFDLDYIEQPLAVDDIHDHALVQREIATAICLDESIRTPADCRKALAAGAARVINIKVGRVGGYTAAKAIHDVSEAFGAPVWCGGMLESGIGRAHNIHLATLPNFTKPGDTSSASRYFHRDIIAEPLEATGGLMPVPGNGAGIGVTLDRPFLNTVTRSTEEFRP